MTTSRQLIDSLLVVLTLSFQVNAANGRAWGGVFGFLAVLCYWILLPWFFCKWLVRMDAKTPGKYMTFCMKILYVVVWFFTGCLGTGIFYCIASHRMKKRMHASSSAKQVPVMGSAPTEVQKGSASAEIQKGSASTGIATA